MGIAPNGGSGPRVLLVIQFQPPKGAFGSNFLPPMKVSNPPTNKTGLKREEEGKLVFRLMTELRQFCET